MRDIRKLLTLLLLGAIVHPVFSQSLAWRRANSLERGVNISWLENYWLGTQANGYSDYLDLDKLPARRSDMALIAELGFKTVRLPVCFDVWFSREAPYTNLKPGYWAAIDSFIHWAIEYDLRLIIVNHHGVLVQANYETETERVKTIWQEIANRYKSTNADTVMYEIYNEPHDIDAATWDISAGILITAVRAIDKNRTIITGGVDYNSINGLKSLGDLNDTNIIYTFHFYDPFLFTHQGASWVGDPVATTGIPYPYNATTMPPINSKTVDTWGEYLYNSYSSDGTKSALHTKVTEAKSWSNSKNLPVFCGEWGSYGAYADPGSRCKHAMDVIAILKEKQIPWTMWDWDQGFSFFYDTPAINHIISCMEIAYGFFGYQIAQIRETKTGFEIYPNILNGENPSLFFTLDKGISKDVMYKLVNLTGQIITTGEIKIWDGNGELNLDPLSHGMYFLQLSDRNNVWIDRFVIQ